MSIPATLTGLFNAEGFRIVDILSRDCPGQRACGAGYARTCEHRYAIHMKAFILALSLLLAGCSVGVGVTNAPTPDRCGNYPASQICQ